MNENAGQIEAAATTTTSPVPFEHGIAPPTASAITASRLPAIDWVRGLAVVLMVTDHASEAFNASRPVTDSALFYDPRQPIDAFAFGFRWLSHFCAPAFLFLAGTSLALSISRKRARGASALSIDRDLLVRGLIIIAIDLTFIHYVWVPNLLLLQVMFAIGVSMILMIPLRRLPATVLGLLAVAVFVVNELLSLDWFFVPATAVDIGRALLLSAGWIELPDAWGAVFGPEGSTNAIIVAYPALPWWSMMALGWVFGAWLVRRRSKSSDGPSPARVMLIAGVISLAVFAVLRGLNGFGNLALLRQDHSWVQWLHVSKYPPSLTFTALELGLMALLLAVWFRYQDTPGRIVSPWNPLLVFGQTAFFFYLAHILVLEVAGRELDMYQTRGLKEAVIAFVVVTIALYPACLWYRKIKARYPRSPLRYF